VVVEAAVMVTEVVVAEGVVMVAEEEDGMAVTGVIVTDLLHQL
jgi:hypothetical protein